MSERKEILREKLRNSRERLNKILDQVGDRWETRIYEDGAQWNARQLVAHLKDAEVGMIAQLKSIAEGGEGVPADFDIQRYNLRATEKNAEVSPDASRAALATSRAALLLWLDEVDEAKLDNKGRHASLNIFTVEQIIRVIASHERDHGNDIARVLNITLEAS